MDVNVMSLELKIYEIFNNNKTQDHSQKMEHENIEKTLKVG